jgi:hypothetical protein
MNTLSEIKDKLFCMRSGMDYQEVVTHLDLDLDTTASGFAAGRVVYKLMGFDLKDVLTHICWSFSKAECEAYRDNQAVGYTGMYIETMTTECTQECSTWKVKTNVNFKRA